MSVLGDVLKELAKMFFGEPRMAIGVLALIALAALAARFAGEAACGALLLFGAFAVLAENVLRAARRAR
ncbi:MAG: hypothetical protein AB7M12_13460 [Hyphomonadaceae bacterium]